MTALHAPRLMFTVHGVFIIAEGSFLNILSLSRHLHTARILRIQGHWSCHDYNA